MEYRGFQHWDEVLNFADRFGHLYYKGPLDYRPVSLEVSRRGKGRMLRVNPPIRDASSFWADGRPDENNPGDYYHFHDCWVSALPTVRGTSNDG